MKPILILQSCAPNAPRWVRECMHTVQYWASLHGHHYISVEDELFNFGEDYCRPPFNKVTRSDICRLHMMGAYISFNHYSAVYWIDSDILVWNRAEFKLPSCEACAVVCSREAFKMHDGCTGLFTNNSIIGLCTMDDVSELIRHSERILDRCDPITPPRTTVIGTDFFSSRKFPMKQILVKSNGCLSQRSIDIILGPRISAFRHLWFLSLAHGGTLHAANLCSSREKSDERMLDLIGVLVSAPHWPLRSSKYITPFYRVLLRSIHFPQRVRCWTITRLREFRIAISGKT